MPRLLVGLKGDEARFAMSNNKALTDDQRTLLVQLDSVRKARSSPLSTDFRLVHVGPGKWAIGRSHAKGSFWRILNRAAWRKVKHPADLWLDDFWFGRTSEDAADEPERVPLSQHIEAATLMLGGRERVAKAVAAAVRAHRDSSQPVSILIPRKRVAKVPYGGVGLVSVILYALGPERRAYIAVSTFEATPSPERWDLVLTDQPADGYRNLDAMRPGTFRDDPVAVYLYERIMAGDWQSVQDAHELSMPGMGPTADAWAEGILQARKDGLGHVGRVTKDLLESDPNRAAENVIERLKMGEVVDGTLATELVAVTLKLSDPRLWMALVERPDIERARALEAWIELADKGSPTDSLLWALEAVRPKETLTREYVGALVELARQGQGLGASPEILGKLLLSSPAFRGAEHSAERVGAWTTVIGALVSAGRGREAENALLTPMTARLCADGASRAVVSAWLGINPNERSSSALQEICRRLQSAPDGAEAAASLLSALEAESALEEAELVVSTWARRCAVEGLDPHDPVLDAVQGSRYTLAWARAIGSTAALEAIRDLIIPIVRGSGNAEVWRETERAASKRHAKEVTQRLMMMQHFLPEGAEALEAVALPVLIHAMPALRFPNADLSAVAAAFAQTASQASPLWMWVALAGAEPDGWPEDTIDATIVDFLEAPPYEKEEREAAITITEKLGAATGWEPLDHARWIVRLTTAVPGRDPTSMGWQMAAALARSLGRRRDAIDRITLITSAFLELPVDHPTLEAWLDHLLLEVWPSAAPDRFVTAIDVLPMRPRVRSAWQRALGGNGNPLGGG